MKKRLLTLLSVLCAFCLGLGTFFSMPKKEVLADSAEDAFSAIGNADYVEDISYGEFAMNHISGGGIMVTTRNKSAEYVNSTAVSNTDNPWLIDFDTGRYPVGVSFNKTVDISDNTADDTLIELAFPAWQGTENSRYMQAKAYEIIIADATNPDKYIAVYLWDALQNGSATSSAWDTRITAGATWETQSGVDVYSSDTGYDNGSAFTSVGDIAAYETTNGLKDANIRFATDSNSTAKVQFDNETGKLYVNGKLIRSFKDVSPSTNYFDGFTNNEVKISVGVVRSNKYSRDEFSRFCIMNIDGNSLQAKKDGKVYFDGQELKVNMPEVSNKSDSFTAIGNADFVQDISYGQFDNVNFSGSGVMVITRNKANKNASSTAVSNSENPWLIQFDTGRYPVGVSYNSIVDISDNTASDTLIELAFPNLPNSNNSKYMQAKAYEIIIADATNPDKYIALYIWDVLQNGDATSSDWDTRITAGATWETQSGVDVYSNDTGYDNGTMFTSVADIAAYETTTGVKDANIRFATDSKSSVKVQFDNETGKLYVNGKLIRSFKDISPSTKYFDGFTNDEVIISVGVVRSNKYSTDEFSRFCIMSIDGETFESSYKAPESGLIASGETVVPNPIWYNPIDGGVTADVEFTVNVTTPSGTLYEAVEENKFDFAELGNYTVEYFVEGQSIGETTFTSAALVDGELYEITEFTVSDTLAKGDSLTLNDLLVKCDAQALDLVGVNVIIKQNGTALETSENVDNAWTSIALDNGTYEICVRDESFAVCTQFIVNTCIDAGSTIENGSVKVNGLEGKALLLEGSNTIQIIANEGYKLDTFTIGGVDVTDNIVNGYYTYDAQDVSNNVYYTASFSKLTYSVTYMVGDEVLQTVEGVEYGTQFSDVTAPTIPEKEGYEIIGWSVDADLEIKENLNVNAVYGLKTYTITFDCQGGSEIDAKEYTADEIVTAFSETTTKEGYDFDGWYNGDTKFVFGSILTEDITLTAKWVAKKFTVTIVNGLFADTTIEVEYHKAVDTSSISKDGYTFGGLFTDKECTKKYNGEKITGATTLYASWTKNEEQKGGCMGSVSATSIFAGLAILMAGTIIRRKNDKE